MTCISQMMIDTPLALLLRLYLLDKYEKNCHAIIVPSTTSITTHPPRRMPNAVGRNRHANARPTMTMPNMTYGGTRLNKATHPIWSPHRRPTKANANMSSTATGISFSFSNIGGATFFGRG